MSLEVWLKTGKKVEIGGRELWLMPLPLTRLFKISKWVEDTSLDVVHDYALETKDGELPNPFGMVTRILTKVDVAEVAVQVFSFPKDPDTREPINKNIDKQFFEDYLDLATSRKLFMDMIAMNDVEELIKNLQSLPIVKKVMEAAQLTFGIPYLNFLQQSTVSAQKKLEGSPSPKSTDTSMPSFTDEQASGQSEVPKRVM